MIKICFLFQFAGYLLPKTRYGCNFLSIWMLKSILYYITYIVLIIVYFKPVMACYIMQNHV